MTPYFWMASVAPVEVRQQLERCEFPHKAIPLAACSLSEFLWAIGDRDLRPGLGVMQGTFPRIAGQHLQARWLGSSTSHISSPTTSISTGGLMKKVVRLSGSTLGAMTARTTRHRDLGLVRPAARHASSWNRVE